MVIEMSVGGRYGNLKVLIEEVIGDEEVLGVVIGECGDGWGRRCRGNIPKEKVGVLLSWDEAKKYLDYEFEHDFGATDECYPVFVWTETKLVVATSCEGFVWVDCLSRFPCDCKPWFVGEGGCRNES